MKKEFVLSRRVMQLLRVCLKQDLWYSQERQNMFEDDCAEYGVYQSAIDEDKKLIQELDEVIKIK